VRVLATALADITGFIRDNRAELKSDVQALTGCHERRSSSSRNAIADVLDVAPLTLSNLNLAYNARSGTLDTRDDVMGRYDPASYVCSLIVDLAPVSQVPKECFALAHTLSVDHLPLTNQLRKLLGLGPAASATAPGGRTPSGVLPGLPGTSGAPGGASSDPTLGGILKVVP